MKRNFKKRWKQFLAISMAFSMILCTNAFATPINLSNSVESVATDTLDKTTGTDYYDDEDTNVWQDGSITEETRVNVQLPSTFEITIPKEVVLNGSAGTAVYKVKAKGDIAGDQRLLVVPDSSFNMSEAGGKADVVATVTQPDTEYDYVKLQNDGTTYTGNIVAPLTAGEWSGKFNFNIEFKAESCEHEYTGILTKKATETKKGEMTYTCSKCNKSYIEIESLPAKQSFADTSWSDINIISESGLAANYFNVGDEKEIIVNRYSYKEYGYTKTHYTTTYHVQILGFNHDYKSDGTGKAGITLGFKEIMSNGHMMAENGENAGGWRDSKMRTYVNNDVYNALPSDLQAIIKTVNKKSDNGYKGGTTLNTTQDKLFLLSPEEIGFNPTSTNYVQGQGTKYEYFTDNNLRIKYKDGSADYWWLRSATTNLYDYFFRMSDYNDYGVNKVNYLHGVVPAFCI